MENIYGYVRVSSIDQNEDKRGKRFDYRMLRCTK